MDWNGRKVLVTGAGGFIGSHLAERLVQLGADVRALLHYNALGSAGWLDHSPLLKDIETVFGDVCDRDSVAKAMAGREIVFHLAALIGIPYSYRAPESYVKTNVMGTLNVLQCARDTGVGRVVHTSTSEVYGTALYTPIDEKHPLQGQSPYSASKIGADKMAEAFHLSFGLPVVTVRPFNTFGPRQSSRAVIPTIITQLMAGPRVKLGSISPTRDLNYVSDTVEGFVLAGQAEGAIGRTINLGRGEDISVGDVALLLARLMNTPIEIEEEGERIRPEGSEVMQLVADNRMAVAILGWTVGVSWEQGLRATVDWFSAHGRESPHSGRYVV